MPPPVRGERLIRLCLRLFPATVRDNYGDDIIDAAREERRRHGPGVVGLIQFWIFLLGDLARGLARGRFGHRGSRSPHDIEEVALMPVRTGSSLSWFRGLGRDLQVGLRSFRRTPGTALLVTLTLTLAIGMTSAMFTLANAVLLSPLPHRDADRLMYIESRRAADDVDNARFSSQIMREMRNETMAFSDIAAFTTIRQNLTGVDQAEQVHVGWVSGNFFPVLGTRPALGRLLHEDDPPGTAVLSHTLWETAFGRTTEVIGHTVSLDGHGYTIVGVLPADFRFQAPDTVSDVAIWKSPDNLWQNGDIWGTPDRTLTFLSLMGRLAPGVSVAQANDELSRTAARLQAEEPKFAAARFEISARPLLETIVRDVRSPILLLLGAAGFVLLIACANVMNLLLVRAQGRQHELAVRLALGSGRIRLLRLLFAESLLLAAAGGAGGLLLARIGLPALLAADIAGVPRLENLAVDWRVTAFAATAAVFCTFSAGLAPALWAGRLRIGSELATLRSTASRSRQRASHGLVVAQVALSLILLIGAGLLAVSLVRTQRVEPGFDATHLATFAISLPGAKYTWPEGTNRFLREFERRLEALPGVDATAVVWPLPLSDGQWRGGYVGGAVTTDDRVLARQHLVTPDYFDTVRTPIVEGRNLGTDDPKTVVVVSRALAERAWPGESAVGKRLEAAPWGPKRWFDVIGVAENVRFRSLREPPEQVIYLDAAGWSWADWEVDVLVRAAADPLAVVPLARAVLGDLDGDIPLARPRAMTAYIDDQLAPGRLALGLVGLFAVVAAVLAAIGLYGVLSHAVALRAREIGIRMALGSRRQAIIGLVLNRGLLLTSVGIVVGLGAAWWVTGLLRGYLFEVEPTDPLMFAMVSTGFLGIAALACVVPARRATRIDPIRVLRGD